MDVRRESFHEFLRVWRLFVEKLAEHTDKRQIGAQIAFFSETSGTPFGPKFFGSWQSQFEVVLLALCSVQKRFR